METSKTLRDRLDSRAGSGERAELILDELRALTGASGLRDENCLAALGLIKLGADPASVAREVSWQEFEELCARILKAAGYSTRRNVMLKKPRRQIDILAESGTLILSIDCKHWKATVSPSALSALVEAQVQRTILYRRDARLFNNDLPVLPMLLTLTDSLTYVVDGVPVVPLVLLRDFLLNLSRYDSFAFL